MHTFFINASGQRIENYSDILEIQHETRKLISLDCPIDNWYADNGGYRECVRKIGYLIDTHKGINNSFNLIIYLDLVAVEKYSSIPLNSHLERYACLEAMYPLFKHYINSTIVDELKNRGRRPNEVLVIFEENRKPEDKDDVTQTGRDTKNSYIRSLMGFPETEELKNFISEFETDNNEYDVADFCRGMSERYADSVVKNLVLTYEDEMDTFLKEVKETNSCEKALKMTCKRIADGNAKDDKEINAVSFVTDRIADRVNKRERVRRDLRLSFYILSCVESETVFVENKSVSGETLTSVKEFPEIDWDKAVCSILSKCEEFKKQYKIITTMSESFSALNLAPVLYAFDNEKFALDEYGKKAHEFEIIDVAEEKSDKKAENTENIEDVQEFALGSVEKKAVVRNDVCAESLFNEDKFKAFDYKGNAYAENLGESNPDAATYIREASKLREHHIEYLEKFRQHIIEVLSNYACISEENEPALLAKRNTTVTELEIDAKTDECNYTKQDMPQETQKIDTVKAVSKTAYESAVLAYVEFCAGRSVSVSDIEEQCNWFITRVHQIEESLKKMKKIAIGFLIAFVAMFMPFMIIQWDVITKNPVNMAVAAISFAMPLAILCVVFEISRRIQMKKCGEEWKVYKAKADEALSENSISAEKYDKLLSVYIPTLRWVYEYKLDVEFYSDCCKVARAKVNHHKQKLNERINTVKSIIDDLEIDEIKLEQLKNSVALVSDDGVTIDYNVPFCEGELNRNFYSFGIADSVFDA